MAIKLQTPPGNARKVAIQDALSDAYKLLVVPSYSDRAKVVGYLVRARNLMQNVNVVGSSEIEMALNILTNAAPDRYYERAVYALTNYVLPTIRRVQNVETRWQSESPTNRRPQYLNLEGGAHRSAKSAHKAVKGARDEYIDARMEQALALIGVVMRQLLMPAGDGRVTTSVNYPEAIATLRHAARSLSVAQRLGEMPRTGSDGPSPVIERMLPQIGEALANVTSAQTAMRRGEKLIPVRQRLANAQDALLEGLAESKRNRERGVIRPQSTGPKPPPKRGGRKSARKGNTLSGFWDIRPKINAELRKATEIINSQFRPAAAATHVSRAIGLLNEWAALPTSSAREQGAVAVSLRRLQEALGNLHDGNSAAISRANNLILRVLERDLDI